MTMFNTGITAITAIKSITILFLTSSRVFATDTGSSSEISSQTQEFLNTNDYIQPNVRRYTNILPKHICQKLIHLGETTGFALDFDSIDYNEVSNEKNTNSQAIDVMDEEGNINNRAIYDVLEPYIPEIAHLIRSQRDEGLDRQLFPNEEPDRLPKLGWIFYRKYSPQSARNSLIPHVDSNVHTANIALNDDFTGGGLFYVKPLLSQNPTYYSSVEYLKRVRDDGVPLLETHQMTYDWVNSLQRKNTTEVVFPKLETGDVLIHNYTVWHAVAPLEVGVRYSMILFFDMHNPLLYDKQEYEFDAEEYALDPIRITVRHAIRECNGPKLVYIQDDIDIAWVNLNPEPDEEMMEIIIPNLRPGRLDYLDTFPGHIFLALRSLSDEHSEAIPLDKRDVLASIAVESDKLEYDFVSIFTKLEDCEIMNYNEMEGEGEL